RTPLAVDEPVIALEPGIERAKDLDDGAHRIWRRIAAVALPEIGLPDDEEVAIEVGCGDLPQLAIACPLNEARELRPPPLYGVRRSVTPLQRSKKAVDEEVQPYLRFFRRH